MFTNAINPLPVSYFGMLIPPRENKKIRVMSYLLFQSLTFCNRIIFFLFGKTATDLYYDHFLNHILGKMKFYATYWGLQGIGNVFYLHSLKPAFPCVNLNISEVFQGVSSRQFVSGVCSGIKLHWIITFD